MFSLFAGQNITTHMVFVRWGFKRQIFFNSFIYIPKNSYTELLIHYFCGKAPKPHPKTGKRSLKWLFYYYYYFSIFFKGVLFLVSINVTSNCKVNYSKLLNSNFIKTTILHEKILSFIHFRELLTGYKCTGGTVHWVVPQVHHTVRPLLPLSC